MPFMNNIKELCLVPGKVSGDIARFEAASAPLVSCICTINPIQSGSGDPSPSNVRPITGHDDVTITQKDGNNTIVDTATITFPDTVYGGSLDVETGVLTTTHRYFDMGSLSWTSNSAYANVFNGSLLSSSKNTTNVISDTYAVYTSSTVMNYDYGLAIGLSLTVVYVKNKDYSDPTAFKTAMTGKYICYELATPTTTQLTPEQLNSILGDNNFYHDGNGHIDITYIRRIN